MSTIKWCDEICTNCMIQSIIFAKLAHLWLANADTIHMKWVNVIRSTGFYGNDVAYRRSAVLSFPVYNCRNDFKLNTPNSDKFGNLKGSDEGTWTHYIKTYFKIAFERSCIVVWNWNHCVAIAYLYQPSPMDSDGVNSRSQRSDTSSMPTIHVVFFLCHESLVKTHLDNNIQITKIRTRIVKLPW